jgi:peptidoglycan/LPS O-acetylase OafA/YrhL
LTPSAEPTPSRQSLRHTRDRYVDLVRAAAVARVVVYHATGWSWLTVVFPAMATMFALAGSLTAASLDRHGANAVGRRLRRLLPPLWILAAVFVPAMLVTGLKPDWSLLLWALPLTDPPAHGWGALALSVIWYLRDYLWFVLVSPIALPVFRRLPVPAVLAPLALLVAIEFGLPAGTVIRDFALYFGCWLLGFAHHDGMLQRMPRRLLFGLAATAATLGAAWFLTHPGPRGYDLNDIRLGNGLWSTAFVLLVLGLAPATASWVDRLRRVGRTVTFLNRRAVTIYLWHMPVVVGFAALLTPLGLWTRDPAGIVLRVLLVAAGVALPVAAFGWVEDLAARRRPVALPGRARIPRPRARAAEDGDEPGDSRAGCGVGVGTGTGAPRAPGRGGHR